MIEVERSDGWLEERTIDLAPDHTMPLAHLSAFVAALNKHLGA